MMLLKLLPRLASHRIDVHVVSLGPEGACGRRLQECGVEVKYLTNTSGRSLVAIWRGLARELKSFQPDLVQGWMIHGNLFALLGGKIAQCPVVWGVRHSNLPLRTEKLSTVLLDRALALLSRLPRVIVYNSSVGKVVHERMGYSAARSQVIPNGFETELYVPNPPARVALRRELGLPAESLLIGMVGRFHPMKDHATFLRAAGMFCKAHPEARFILVGEGCTPDNPDLQRTVLGAGVRDHVFLVGDRRDIPEVTAALDIATSCSSSSEGFANVIGEAMSCAVPCVVTDVGDSAHVVGDPRLVIPAGDSQALSGVWQWLVHLGEAGRRNLGGQARQRIVEKYSIDQVVGQFGDLYRRTAQC
jgi:glycosyltransferase involved in cell wall biosynthesis